MELFAAHGVEAVSVRSIAAAAGVSPALVIHHFGSKEGLRAACDAVTLDTARQAIARLLSTTTDPSGRSTSSAVLAQLAAEPTRSALAYLARAVVDGGEAGDALIDEVVAMTRAGLAEPTARRVAGRVDDLEMTAVLLTLFDLAPLVMARHVHRMTGSDPYTSAGFARVARAALALYETPTTDGRELPTT
jgi:AcrR family transcriptional regulator